MRIASRESVPGRVHSVAGKAYTFNPLPNTASPMVCDVEDPAAVAVFLHQRNANLFYAYDPPAVTITRPAQSGSVADNPPKTPDPVAPSVAVTLLDQAARHVIEALEPLSIDELSALKTAERAGKARKTVIEAIDEHIAARATDVARDEAKEQATLVLNNETDVVVQLLESISDTAILAEALAIERTGANRPAVLSKLQAALGA